MNTKNKQHTIYLDYAACLILAKLGLPQEASSAYWSKNDGKIFQTESITKFKGWQKCFVAAVTGEELNQFIPQYTVIERSDPKNWKIHNARYKAVSHASTEGEAKVKFLATLVKNGSIKLN